MKTLHNTDSDGAEKNVPDIVKFGNADTFQLICKASSKKENWMKSTKAMEIWGLGCVIQVTTQQGDNVAEALTFVPGTYIHTENDVRSIRKIPEQTELPPIHLSTSAVPAPITT